VAYFTINPKLKEDSLSFGWLSNENLMKSGPYVDWYQFKEPFIATLDGTTGNGLIFKPEPEEIEFMDEEESSGI
jgi:hypothetical protein